MTGRQRLMNLLNGIVNQDLAWNALVDTHTLSAMPEEVQAETVVDFCRRLGCDALQLGDFSMPEALWVGDPYQVYIPEVTTFEQVEPDGTLVRLTHTPWGDLQASFRNSHPLKYPVTNLEEIQILRRVWQATEYGKADPGWLARYQKMDQHIGHDGIHTHFLWPSPVQRLILRRARAIADLLSGSGVDPSVLDIASHGKDNPLVPTGDQVSEPRNRRVEVTVR